jgi:hypothetical protein
MTAATSASGIAVPVITDDMAEVDAALALAKAGIYVFPVDHPEIPVCVGIGKTHNPFSTDHRRGKHPCVPWGEKATIKEHLIRAYWSQGRRNIGIHCGKCGLVVVDEDKLGEFKKYADEHGVKIPPTLVVATANGRHYYFAAREDHPLGNEEGAFQNYDINIRGVGGFVVAPGSTHETGVIYRIEVALPPAPIPDWVIDAIKAKTNGHKTTTDDGIAFENIEGFERFELPDVIPDHHRDETLFRFACSMRTQGLTVELAKVVMEGVGWPRCEQPPIASHEYTLEEALAKVTNAYTNYYEGRSEGYEKQGDSGGNRPQIDVRNDALAAEWLRSELGRGRLAGIFRRDDLLVHTPRMGEQGYLPPADLGLIDAGPAQVRPITTAGIKSLIETRYRPWRTITVREGNGSTKVEIEALFPQQSAQSACEAARLGEYAPHLRTLHGVTHTPMMRPDGTILNTPGYDAPTGFLYLPDLDLKLPPIPNQPTREQVKAAVELILTPVAEFPFVSEDDRATWIGLAFTPALRPLLPGPYQLGVITATNPGSGKTLLAKMIRILHGGAQRGEMPRDADELRKSITAALMDTTAPVIAFDNLTGVVRSSVLESLLTDNTWTDRWLGQNRSVTATNDRLWLATGNNAQFGGDLARRIATVALNPPEANHHERTDFTIKDLEAWMQQHRGDILAAILTVARGWVVAQRPSANVRSDSYAGWIGGLRGLLGWAEFPGVFGGGNHKTAMSSDDEEWHTFLVALFDEFGADPFTVKDIVHHLHPVNPFNSNGGNLDAAALPGDLPQKWAHVRDGNDGGFRKSLGWWLKNHERRYADGWALVSAGTIRRVPSYAIKEPKR